MSEIERCWVATHPGADTRLLRDEAEAERFRRIATWTVVEYVPADTYQGALEEILADLRRPDAPRPDFYPAVAHAIKVAETALAHLRDSDAPKET